MVEIAFLQNARVLQSESDKDTSKRVARAIECALILGNADAWHIVSVVLTACLTDQERAALLWAALRAQTPEQAEQTYRTAMTLPGAGMPQAPLLSYIDQAAFWADMAEPEELDAYCLACFMRLPPKRQAEFLEFAKKVAA